MKKFICFYIFILCNLLFTACEKDKYQDYEMNLEEVYKDNPVLQIESGTAVLQASGKYYTRIDFSYFIQNVPQNATNIKIVLFRDGKFIVSMKPLISNWMGDYEGIPPGTYKYELALLVDGVYGHRSKPYYLTCN